jgi:hypothetical protein
MPFIVRKLLSNVILRSGHLEKSRFLTRKVGVRTHCSHRSLLPVVLFTACASPQPHISINNTTSLSHYSEVSRTKAPRISKTSLWQLASSGHHLTFPLHQRIVNNSTSDLKNNSRTICLIWPPCLHLSLICLANCWQRSSSTSPAKNSPK